MTQNITQDSASAARPAVVTFAFCVAVVFFYGLFIAAGSREGFPEHMNPGHSMPYLADKPVGEDGFYMLKIAWNLAEGEGLAYNYGKVTTGIQPLATFVYAGIAWVVQAMGGDQWAFLRAVLVFGSLNLVLLGLMNGNLALQAFQHPAARRDAYLLAASMTILNFWLYRTMTYGLETGIYLVLLVGCITYSLRVGPDSGRRHAGMLGVLAGFTGLARLDFGVVLFAFLAFGVLFRRFRLSFAFVVGAVALGIVFPWLAWVHSQTGSWLPSSGPAQAKLVTLSGFGSRAQEMTEALLNHLTPWVYTGSRPDLTGIALVTLLLLAGFLWRWRTIEPVPVTVSWKATLMLWGIATTILVPVYVVFFWATHFYERYTAPLLVVALLLLATVMTRWLSLEKPHWFSVAPALLLGAFGTWAYLSLHTGQVGNQHTVTAGFVQEHFPSPHVVGAFQSGVIGYFNENVVNLDGKIDPEALLADQNDRLYAFVDSNGIGVIIDSPGYIRGNLPRDYLNEYWEPCSVKPNNSSICYVKK